jgi:hypothetical protein
MSKLDKFSDEEIIAIEANEAEAELRRRGYEYGWFKKEQYVGAIYILVNPSMQGLVKIGYADDVKARVRSLSSSAGVPDPYHCYALYRVKKRLEDLRLHKLIDTLDPDLRHSKKREFYEMSCEKAFSILSSIAQINGSEEQLITNPFEDENFASSKPVISKSTDTVKSNTKQGTREQFSFSKCGIHVGAELIYMDDPSQKVYVLNDRKVSWNGQTTSLSAVACQLRGWRAAQGPKYFSYNGKPLIDIANETIWK